MLQDFWQEILTIWQTGILNTNLGHIFIALGVFLKNAAVPAPELPAFVAEATSAEWARQAGQRRSLPPPERLRVYALKRFDAQTRRQVAPWPRSRTPSYAPPV